MDTNILTILGTFTVAIISGLFALTNSLSTKEKEIKLSTYEKLGLDVHTILEDIYNNVQYKIIVFQFKLNPIRSDLIEADKKYKLDIDRIRELRMRIMFFDKKSFRRYEKIIESHGTLTPNILGYTKSGKDAVLPQEPYTQDEINHFVIQLSNLLKEIEEAKEYITKKAAQKYHRTINSSRKIFISTIILILIFMAMFIAIPLKDQVKGEAKDKVTLVCS
ncbi:hypothetical protein [Kosakonia sacchari]